MSSVIIICAPLRRQQLQIKSTSTTRSQLACQLQLANDPPLPLYHPLPLDLPNIQSQSAELMNCIRHALTHTHTQGVAIYEIGGPRLYSRPDYSCLTQNICKSNANCWRHNHRTANWQRGIDSIFILANFMLNMPPFAFNS